MAKGLNDLYGGNDVLEEVIILPLDSTRQNTGTWQSFNLPAGYTWGDFLYIEAFAGNDSAAVDTVASDIVTKEQIAQNPTSFRGYTSFQSSSGAQYQASYRATGATSGEWLTGGNGTLQLLKGYTKRYASRNISAIVNVNGGANIAVNRRYEIDIATELGADYVGRDLIVQAEVYNDTGDGVVGWGSVGSSDLIQDTSGTVYGSGVEAHTLNDKIIVQTGADFLLRASTYCGNPFGNANNHTALPCRVKVWKIDQYITPTTKGGAGKTVLYDGAGTGAGVLVLSDSYTKYDELRIYCSWNVAGTHRRAVGIVDPELLTNSGVDYVDVHNFYLAGNNNAYFRFVHNANTSELSVNSGAPSDITNRAIYKVVGINYQ